MPTATSIRGEIIRLADRGLDFHELAPAATRVLRRAVPFDGVAIVAFDPATALPVDRWIDDAGELADADMAKFRELAAERRRAEHLGHRLWAVCVGESGLWGGIVLQRDSSVFAAREVNLLAVLTGAFPEAQRGRLEQDVPAAAVEREPGLLLLAGDDAVEEANAAAAAWLTELREDGTRLPVVVRSVAERARAITSGRSDVAARARVRAPSGRWVLVRGSVLGDGARTAVTLEPARAPEMVELMAEAHGLTARERHVADLIAQGLPNAAIAANLHLSPYTVQDHLKAVFEKFGVSSRGQLVARLYVDAT
jgi:DNA-binding CsgD family transcriptional regulator